MNVQPSSTSGAAPTVALGHDAIPERFWLIEYDQNHDANSPELPSISESPNCQNFAYSLLAHFGHEISSLRSSNLWEDTQETSVVSDELMALDLLLFNFTSSAWGAHVALCLGDNTAIHLSKKEVTAAIWPISKFLTLPEYRIFIGAKRLRRLSKAV